MGSIKLHKECSKVILGFKKNTYYAIKRWMISLGEHGYVSYIIRCQFYLFKKIHLLSFDGNFVYVLYIKKLWLLVTFFLCIYTCSIIVLNKNLKKRHITLLFNFLMYVWFRHVASFFKSGGQTLPKNLDKPAPPPKKKQLSKSVKIVIRRG